MHIGEWMQNPDARILRFLRSQLFVRFPMLSAFITFSRGDCKKAGACKSRMHIFYTFSTYGTFSTHHIRNGEKGKRDAKRRVDANPGCI